MLDFAFFDNVKRAVAELTTVSEVLVYIDKSAGIEEYARRSNDKELEIKACHYRLMCERQAGKLMLEIKRRREKVSGGRVSLYKTLKAWNTSAKDANNGRKTLHESLKAWNTSSFEDALDTFPAPKNKEV